MNEGPPTASDVRRVLVGTSMTRRDLDDGRQLLTMLLQLSDYEEQADDSIHDSRGEGSDAEGTSP